MYLLNSEEGSRYFLTGLSRESFIETFELKKCVEWKGLTDSSVGPWKLTPLQSLKSPERSQYSIGLHELHGPF